MKPRGQAVPVDVVKSTICIDLMHICIVYWEGLMMRKCITVLESEGRLR